MIRVLAIIVLLTSCQSHDPWADLQIAMEAQPRK